MKRTFFRVKTQYDNLGDALINRELIHLCSLNSFVEIGLSSCPCRFKNWMNLHKKDNIKIYGSICSFWFRLVLSLIRREQVYLFLNPGGYGGEISYKQFIFRFFNNFFLIFLKSIGVKTCVVGVSYEDLGPRNMLTLKYRSKALYFHGVRDNISKSYCIKNGINNVSLINDLAFAFKSAKRESYARNGCLVSMRDGYRVGATALNLISNLFPQEEIILSSQVERDLDIQVKIMSAISGRLSVRDLGLVESIDDAYSRYASVKYVVSNRLHVLILAWIAGAIPIALVAKGKNKKIRGVFEDLRIGIIVDNDFSAKDLKIDEKEIFMMPHDIIYENLTKVFHQVIYR